MEEFANATADEIEIFHARIAANIKRLRKERQITQLDMAYTIGLGTVTFYVNAENCRQGKHFNVEHIYKIAKYLEVDMKVLFGEVS